MTTPISTTGVARDPYRVILRISAALEDMEWKIHKHFVAQDSRFEEGFDDYYHHNEGVSPERSHAILDIHSRADPNVDLSAIPHEIYRVRRKPDGEL